MSTAPMTPMTPTTAPVSLAGIQAFLYRESRLLDDEQWDEWLACYHPWC